jgi:hypothetical protein
MFASTDSIISDSSDYIFYINILSNILILLVIIQFICNLQMVLIIYVKFVKYNLKFSHYNYLFIFGLLNGDISSSDCIV